MAMTQAVGQAPGKILLVGEHAVVYGHPAIAIPIRGISARAEVELSRNGGLEFEAVDLKENVGAGAPASARLEPLVRLVGSVLNLFGEKAQGLKVRLHSTIPIGRGMGSGAAVSVALVKGVCKALGRKLNADQVAELALEAERVFHSNPSGVDTAVVARNEAVYYVRGKAPQDVEVGSGHFRFLIADTGIESPTGKVVEDVRRKREQDRARVDSYFWELGSMATVAREIIRGGMPAELGACMTHSHGVLQGLGVSSTELDRLVETALERGALGAKLSGAGCGGAMIVLLDEDADANEIETALRIAGAVNVYSTALGAPAMPRR
jgi:mevalonate kinase